MDLTLSLGPQGILFSYTDTSVDETGVNILSDNYCAYPISHYACCYSSLVWHIRWSRRINE
jgi:hypothetical protein